MTTVDVCEKMCNKANAIQRCFTDHTCPGLGALEADDYSKKLVRRWLASSGFWSFFYWFWLFPFDLFDLGGEC